MKSKSKKSGIIELISKKEVKIAGVVVLAALLILSFVAIYSAGVAKGGGKAVAANEGVTDEGIAEAAVTEVQTPAASGGGAAATEVQTAAVVDVGPGTSGLAYALINDNTQYMVKAGTARSGAVVIPAAHNGRPVTSIGASAFENCTGITSITIASGVTRIEHRAFYGCTSLTRITIPNTVTHIDVNAFENCTSLISVAIPNSVNFLGMSAFRNCTNLTSATIGNGVASININTFEFCKSLNSVTIGNGVTTINSNAFAECTNLARVTIGNRVSSIGMNAFTGCTSLASIIIPSSVTSIGVNSFNCNNLTSVTFQGTITSGNFSRLAFPGDLRSKYLIPDERSGGRGTYTRPDASSKIWLKK